MKKVLIILAILSSYCTISTAQNTTYGTAAGSSLTTGNYNSMFGELAGQNTTTGAYNSFLGHRAGQRNTTASANTFLGAYAGTNNTTGQYNFFSGYATGYRNTTGRFNSYQGYVAGYNGTTATHNNFSGGYAGFTNTTGSRNTYIGHKAGYQNSTGSDNVFLGYQAGHNETGSNKLYIGNSSSNTLIYGNFSTGNVGIGTTTPTNKLDVCGTIRGKEVRVQSGWCDYVFLPDYQLPTLVEEEQHIQQNGHLLGFESEATMDGEIQLGDVSKRQQAKIEELMLHLIAMDKEFQQLKAKNATLEQEVQALKQH